MTGVFSPVRRQHHWQISASLCVIANQLLRATLSGALLTGSVVASAQDAAIVPIPDQPATTTPSLDMAANGTPVVKIATPANGTSYNRYQDFNVDARGLILNNSDKIVTTSLAGYIDGNANLKTSGPASLIVNEVAGAAPSNLAGYIEIAGSKADLVLANPYGITCRGCGFLNAASVALAAASPVRGSDGSLSSYHIADGTLTVNGHGLDASGARLDLFARAIVLNGGVWADSINASFGAGDARSGTREIVVTAQSAAQADQPAFGLDVAGLGGMYARSIRLIGTEAGLGVNVDGSIAGLERGVSLSADGRIAIAGTLTSTGGGIIKTAANLAASGQLYTDGQLAITSASVTGDGLIASGSNLSISSGSVTGAATIAAGLARDGSVSQTGNLALTSSGTIGLDGEVMAHDTVTLSAAAIDLTGRVQGSGLTATAASIGVTGDVRSSGALDLSASGGLTSHGLIQGQTVTLQSASLDNTNGVIDAGASLAVQTGATLNVAGLIQSAGGLMLSGSSLTNDEGKVLALGNDALQLGVSGALANANGQIATNGVLTLTAASLDNTAGRITAGNSGELALKDNLVNDGGQIASGLGLTLTAGTVSNARGTIETTGLLDTRLASLGGDGGRVVATGTGAALNFDATGSLTGANALIGSAGSATVAAGSVMLGTGSRLTGANTLTVTARSGDLALGGGSADGGTLTLTSTQGTVSTGTGGLIVTPGTLTLSGQSVDLSGGAVQGQTVTLAASTFGNLGGNFNALGNASLSVSGLLDNTGGQIFAGNGLILDAGALANSRGRIAHAGTGTLLGAIGGGTDNSDGEIVSNGTLALTAKTLINDRGLIASALGGTLTADQTLSNLAGTIQADKALTINASSLSNDGGHIDSIDALDLTAASVANGSGTIIARGGTGLSIGAPAGQTLVLTNGTGTIGASGDVVITASSVVNQGLMQGTSISLDASVLANGGTIYGDTLGIRAATLTNTGGQVGATGAAAVAASSSLDNRSGQIVAGSTGLTLTTALLLNDAGVLASDGLVTLLAASTENGTGQIAAGNDLMVSGGILNTTAGGALWAAQDATLNLSGGLANRGSIGAARDLVVRTTVLDNGTGTAAGTLAAAHLLDITMSGGTLGKLVASDTLTLALAGDYVNAAGEMLGSQGVFNLSIGGNFANDGIIEAGTGLELTGGAAIVNSASGSIAAPALTISAAEEFDNRGLINGQSVRLSGQSVSNEAAIFGDTVAISGQQSILNQGAPAIIATRSLMLSLASAGAITNRDGAWLYSLGDIALTGPDGAGSAASFTNASGMVQAQGDILINANTVTNNRALFTTQESVLSATPHQIINNLNKRNRTVLDYTETVTDTTITADSGASTIVGNNITINAATLLNDISTISASGNLALGAANVTNSAFTGYHTVTGTGTLLTQSRSCPIFGCKSWHTNSTTPYSSVDAKSLFAIPSVITAGGALAIDAHTIDNLVTGQTGGNPGDYAAYSETVTATVLPGTAGLARVSGSSLASVGAALAAATPATVTGQAAGTPGSLTLNLSGLFHYADPSANFLVETNPAFTNYGNFLSTDYFIDRLGYDPTRVQRRLGDAFYEHQLISDQLVAVAGVQRLAGFSDSEVQYRSLMDAGVAYMQRFGLALGVGLSAEQMATLTTDIVLLVEVTVETPSGPQKVLAPRVYLSSVHQQDLTTGGAIIAGREIALRSADALTNAGVIRASAESTITAGTIANTGRLDLGAHGVAAASDDLTSRGGVITGGDVMLAAGGNLTLEAAATTATMATAYRAAASHQGMSLTKTASNIGSQVTAGGNLALISGRKVTITGSDLAAGGNLTASGQDGIVIGSAVDSMSGMSVGREGKALFTQNENNQTHRLSTLSAGGNTALVTEGQLSIKGGAVDAGGALDVQAGSIAVEGVTDSASLTRDTVTRTGGLLSSTTTTTHYAGTGQTAVSSTLSGDIVNLASTGGTRILGSNAVASNGLTIAAGGTVGIGSMTETDTVSQSHEVKKSGLSLDSGGLFAGVARTKSVADTSQVTSVGSLVGSENGDVSIVSGDKLSVTGSTVAGGADVLLAGKSIDIANAVDTSDTSSTTRSSSFGLSVGASSPILAGVTAAADMAQVATSSGNERTQAVAALAGGLGAYNAYGAASKIGSVSDLRNAGQVSVTLGFSSSKSASATSDEAVVGSLVTGNNVMLLANGAGVGSTIDITGSAVRAAKNLTVAAEGDIALAAAAAHASESGTSKSSGASIGVSISARGIGATASVNSGHGNYSGFSTTYTDAAASAGNIASVTTPRALDLTGGQLSASQVKVDVGNLGIVSLQDTSTHNAKSSSFGLSVSVPIAGAGSAAISGNLSSSNQQGTFASVGQDKQAGIYVGSEGFAVNVGGNTSLVGGVIASTADIGSNSLTTGTLTSSDIQNRERYSAREISLGSGITFGPASNVGQGNGGKVETPASTSGSALPGLAVAGLGTISASPPVAMGAHGDQSGTTDSAIAPGAIVITSGDATSGAVAASISRDTAGVNDGALAQQFTDARREEIALGFDAARTLSGEAAAFLANRATDDAEWRAKNPDEDPATSPFATWGAGGAGNIVLTALNGAASGNVAGSSGGLVQASAVNVLQSLATSEVKDIADDLNSEEARFALQGIVGCAGAAAGGSGDCGSAAMGAATSVVLNNLLDGLGAPRDEDRNHDGVIDTADERLSLKDQQARTDLVATLVTAIAEGAGLDATSANYAARIETQNNANVVSNGKTIIQVAEEGGVSIEEFKAGWPDAWNEALGLFGGNEEALIAHLRSPEGQSLEEAGDAYIAAQIEMAAGGDSAMSQKLQDQYASGTLTGAQIAEMAEVGRQLYLENAIANAAGPAVADEVIVNEMIAAGLVSPHAAQLPFAEFAANYSGPLGRYVMSSGKRPNAPAIVGMIAGGVLAMSASHLIPDLPEPVQETFPADPPDSKAGIEAYPDQSEEVGEYGQLPGLLPEPALSPPLVTPMPDAQPPLPGYGEGADVPTGLDVLANDSAPNRTLTSSDFPDVNARLSTQRQARHIEGGTDPRTGQPVTGSVMRSQGDAQQVLDAYRSGDATVIGQTQQGFPVVRYDGVTGLNNNPGAGFVNQETNVFIIKGTSSPSIVPTNPNFGQ
ncbi:two-partner secretion domain-containing protein [Tsuneonella flava]|uniref:two-partner secretion domain-containing protein n=1 Tax=Tsuneonella flava TaxID=2055955 RepID=UPI000C8027F3|nr:hemagglutinin repeat-containing protein [Tsuneonella flava]